MDLTRSPDPHPCLGQAPARPGSRAELDVLLCRLPTPEPAVPADDLRRVEGLVVGGWREVPVRWRR